MSTNYLEWLSAETPGSWWVDTGVIEEVVAARSHGVAGVTMNPLLLARGLAAEQSGTRDVVAAGGALPHAGDARTVEITRRVAVDVAGRLASVYDAHGGEHGYVCAQVNPSLADDASAMTVQAREFDSWAPNVIVKLPVTKAGLEALEACVAEGISIVATVSFAVPQALAIGDAHARGATAARAAGREPGRCFAVIMLGRLDDHLKRVASGVDEETIDRAAIAVAKRARSLFAVRGYEATILPSGMRHPGHVTELAGGEFVFSISPSMAAELADGEYPQRLRVEEPVDEAIVERLRAIPDFVRAYEPDGMREDEFAGFGAAEFTLTQFAREGWEVVAGYEEPGR
ncbi:MAG: transaldolase family protein [Spirochaetota bacterium]